MDQSITNSLDFDKILQRQESRRSKRHKLVDRLDIGLIMANECNVDVIDIQSRQFKIQSSLLPTVIARRETQVSQCALNQITSILVDLCTKA